MNRDHAVRLFAMALSALMLLLSTPDAQGEPTTVFSGEIMVGDDGTGTLSETFDAPAPQAPDTQYVFVIQNGDADPVEGFPAVLSLAATMNQASVYSGPVTPGPTSERIELIPGPNDFTVQAQGQEGSGVRVAILALPADFFGSVTVLPLTRTGSQVETALTLHNAGNRPLSHRVLFYRTNGELAGATGPQILTPRETQTLRLSSVEQLLEIDRGIYAVHVKWASTSRLGLVCEGTEVTAGAGSDRGQGAGGSGKSARTLTVREFPARRLTPGEASEIIGEDQE